MRGKFWPKYQKSIEAVMLLLLLSTCIDPIAFEAEDPIPKLVVFGTFTQLDQDHEITITRTAEFGRQGLPVNGALVSVEDDEGNTGYYVQMGMGRYLLPRGELEGQPGRSYRLKISFNDGESYESSWEKMPEPVEIQDIYYDVDNRKDLSEAGVVVDKFFIDIYIDTRLKDENGDKAFFRWDVYETWDLMDLQCGGLDQSVVCYYEVPKKIEPVNIYTSPDPSLEALNDYRVFTRSPAPYLQFGRLHYFNVYQYSINESAYDYWENVEIVSNPTGSIFDKIPAGVQGNIKEVDGDSEVLGFFEVAAVSIDRTVTTREEISETLQITQQCDIFRWWGFQPDYCCYCFVLSNLIPKPDYWGER